MVIWLLPFEQSRLVRGVGSAPEHKNVLDRYYYPLYVSGTPLVGWSSSTAPKKVELDLRSVFPISYQV
jgi:hypothetical protein